ncbi:MAG: N-acyl homoserine lactonase family protein [Lachnospiraceae bacterium]|nr:N-acyl homoserine lactonase family protein [Lachnospiraceae bacterium]
MKINVLYLGRLDCKKFHLIECRDEQTDILSPVSAILIQHPDLGNILYDTGNSPLYHKAYSEEMLRTYPVGEFISIESALSEYGLSVDDIDMIILSHLHFDHAGGLCYFKGTKAIKNIIVSETELKNAYWKVMTNQGGAYIKELFDIKGAVYKTIAQDTDLAPDLQLFIQNSHTPGVLGLVLSTQTKGNIIVTSDTVYTRENFNSELPPGGKINKTKKEFYDNLKLIQEKSKTYNAELLFGHDYEQIVEWAGAKEIF